MKMTLLILASLLLLGSTAPVTVQNSTASHVPAKPDPQMQAVLDELAALHGKPIETLSASEARTQPTPADAVRRVLQKQGKSTAPQRVANVEDRTLPGEGGALPIRIYRPDGTGPFPVLVYFHGGGWVIGSTEVYDATPRALVTMAHCMVISVDYRLGPEHKFPAAHDDAMTAYQWTRTNAGSINGDSQNVAVGGESAGGNLAVAVGLMSRERGVPLPMHLMVVYPIAGIDTNTESYREQAAARPLNKPMMEWFFERYLRSRADREDPRINLVAANLKGLPPTTVVTDQFDPLRTEGQTLAKKMTAAGVRVNARHFEGVAHEFFSMGAVLDKAREAQQFVASDLVNAFAKR